MTQPQPQSQSVQPIAPETLKQTIAPIGGGGPPLVAMVQRAPSLSISDIPSGGEDTDWWIKALFHGEFGVGKTCFAASAHEVQSMRDILYVNCEAGQLSIRHYSGLVDQVRATNYHTFARVHEYLRLHCRLRDEGNLEKLAELESGLKGTTIDPQYARLYRTVIIDSLTEVQKFCMYQLLGIEVGKYKLDVIPNSPEWKEWGQDAEMIRLLVRSLRDLPMNVIFVCPTMDQESVQKQMIKVPMLPGKLSREVQGFLDIVGYYAVFVPAAQTTVGTNISPDSLRPVHRLYLRQGQTFQAKNRISSEVAYIDIEDDRSGMKQLMSLIATQRSTVSATQTNTPLKKG